MTSCYANHNVVSKENEYYTMRINEYTPKSDWDWFALNLSRSFADLSIISGSLLRAESQLSCRIQGQPNFVASLREFRKVRWTCDVFSPDFSSLTRKNLNNFSKTFCYKTSSLMLPSLTGNRKKHKRDERGSYNKSLHALGRRIR